ncbi:DUF2812 domain-containing protein [Bacillus sp. CHD6a]|uniref:DUF2812 domain-containing protein n=1 Tax=Bacillus sp. CHD6a TaxID=1643452 RepID=UPI0006CDC91C|nr:DUF2812 domain-containing protein [Bacillus sp. CHD6a]KPB06526.1 hypothetical protein AAV98_01670 [Bacillus sp. CHD6a]
MGKDEQHLSTKKIKILWLDLWQIAEQEAWLSDMAAKGWELTKITRLTAHFKKAEPQKIIYKTDILKEPINQNSDRMEQNEQAGWKYVASRGHLHFFRNNFDSSVKEIHTDPIHQAETVKILNISLKTRAYFIALLTLIGAALSVFMLTLDPVKNYLNDEFLSPIIQIFIFIGVNLLILKGLFHLKKLMKVLQSNKRISPDSNFRKKYLLNKLIGLSVIMFFAVIFIYQLSKLGNSTLSNSFPPIPKGELPVIQIKDFTNGNNHKPYFNNKNNNRDNFYFESSSILVPKQYELNQLVEVKGEKWENGSGPYRPSLTSRQYIALNEVLAKRLMQHLIDREEELQSGNASFPETTAFDELVVLENSILSRKGHVIYYVTYYGKEPVEKVINAMELLISD